MLTKDNLAKHNWQCYEQAGLDGIWVDDSNTKGGTEKNTTDVRDNRVGTTAISITELGNCSLVHLFRSHAVSVSLPGHTGTLLYSPKVQYSITGKSTNNVIFVIKMR